MTTPILEGPKWRLSFHIHLDVSNKEIGVIIGKKEYKEHDMQFTI